MVESEDISEATEAAARKVSEDGSWKEGGDALDREGEGEEDEGVGEEDDLGGIE